MNCYLHPETAAVAFCRACGRPLCELCRKAVDGTVFCPEHVPVVDGGRTDAAGGTPSTPGYNPYSQTVPLGPHAPVQTSPALAFVLGLIPLGVGAIYNGQYLKGLIHALIFGLLVSLANNVHDAGQPIVGILAAAFFFYMPFEAYHTAQRRQRGLPVDEWSSILSSKGSASSASIGPIILILIGVAFLLDSLHIIDFWALQRFWPILWPLLLIVFGALALYTRLTDRPSTPPVMPTGNAGRPNTPAVEVQHE